MTRDEILAMKPGPEMNLAVGVNVIGWRWFWPRPGFCAVLVPPNVAARYDSERLFESLPENAEAVVSEIPDYSGSIADAWPVVEAMKNRGKVFIIKADGLMRGDHSPCYSVWCGDMKMVRSDSAPEAISKAALIATVCQPPLRPF